MSYEPAELGDLNASRINWSRNEKPPCTACKSDLDKSYWPPNAGSYASMLAHFETICRNFPLRRSPRLRLLVLFQDPRPDEKNFSVTPPHSTSSIGPNLHRYFCLTPMAWQNLRLHDLIGPEPRWPQESDAHHYLHRYFRVGRGGSPRTTWSYDAIIAYFIWLLRPADAYVTNLAKCYFGDGKRQHTVAIPKCVETHLAHEVKLFRPTAVLSFVNTVQALSDLHDLGLPQGSPIQVVLPAQHPAAYSGGHKAKRSMFRNGLLDAKAELLTLGVDAAEVAASWDRHVDALFEGR